MGMGNTAYLLFKLSCLKGFKIYTEDYSSGYGGFATLVFEADGHRYKNTSYNTEEGILEAYIYLSSRIRAEEIIKSEATIVVPKGQP